MLERVDLKKVFDLARELGFLYAEIYAEVSFESSFEGRTRHQDVRLYRRQGASLRCSNGQNSFHFCTAEISTEAFIALLQQTDYEASDTNAVQRIEEQWKGFCNDSRNKAFTFKELRRQVSAQPQGRLVYHDRKAFFEVANLQGDRHQGEEESAHLSLTWSAKTGEKIQIHRHRSSIAELLREIKESPLFRQAIQTSLTPKTKWPVPEGSMPVLWSEVATSKLYLHFLRAFEGDLYVGNLSFLNDELRPLSFSIVENSTQTGRYDHEGSQRQNLTIFDGQAPRALALNRLTAAQLKTDSTGHCRRKRFDAPPTVGFWNPIIQGHDQQENLLSQMENGISVKDLQIESFNPATGEIEILITDSRLIHHGQEGEPLEKFSLLCPLVDLLATLKVFESPRETHGFMVQKQNQSFLTEITSGRALSPRFPVPGQVPLNHYW